MRIGILRDEWAEGLPLPGYATAGSAGMDLYAAIPENETLELLPGERRLIPTGLHVAIPSGYEGQVRARSGLALKHGIGLVNSPGTIDSDYRGELRVLVINHGTECYSFRRGDRIAQLVISPVVRAELAEEDDSDFWDTARGAGGFGSTGFGTKREQAGADTIGA